MKALDIETDFAAYRALRKQGVCPTCEKVPGEFRDALSLGEYRISGLCQACQDIYFAPETEEEPTTP